MMTDDDWMDLALEQAREAWTRGDWPVGAVMVRDGRVLALGQNRQVSENDLTVHAETDAIRRAQRDHGIDAMAGSTLYCTMEPCPMCAWAVKAAGVHRLVLGLRHAAIDRTDMGRYAFEPFCEMAGIDSVELVTGVREQACRDLRLQWGGDRVRRS